MIDAYGRVRGAGLAVGFATGRLPQGLVRLAAQVGPTAVDVVHNGAQVVSRGAELAQWPLPRPAAGRLARWCLAHQVYAEFYVGGQVFATDFREAARPGWSDVSGRPDGLVADVAFDQQEAVKATINAFDAGQLPAIVDRVRSLDLTVELSTAPILPGTTVVNVTADGVDKGAGLGWALRWLGIAGRQVLVVGDGDNDISMFETAGTAVAMGQAPAHVQAAAHLVSDGVEQDGLALAISSCAPLFDRPG